MTQRQSRAEIVALQLLVGAFLALRLYFDIVADPVGDEAYYWMWSLHPGWSYFDHPPLHAWLLRLVSSWSGWLPLSTRLLTWVTLLGVFAILRDWSRRLAPEGSALWFWRAAAIYLASPLFFAMTTVAYNDHLLVFLSLASIHCFAVYTTRHAQGQPHATRWLYLAAIATGLALLTKYNAVFVALGFAACFVVRPALRPALRTPHPWLALLLIAVMQAPVLYWNVANGLATLRYHLEGRWGGEFGLRLDHPIRFVLLSLVVWSPFLLWPLVRFVRIRPQPGFEAEARAAALAVFAVSSLGLLAVSFVLDAYFYWNIVAFAALTPLLTSRLSSPLLRWAHFAYGLVAAALLVVNFAVTPVTPLFGGRDDGTSINYGWDTVADHVRAAEAATPTDLVAATRYSTTAQLGFALGIADVAKLSPEPSQWDFWQAGAPLTGKSALILADESDRSSTVRWLREHFVALAVVDEFRIVSFGRTIYKWRLFRGEGYTP